MTVEEAIQRLEDFANEDIDANEPDILHALYFSVACMRSLCPQQVVLINAVLSLENYQAGR